MPDRFEKGDRPIFRGDGLGGKIFGRDNGGRFAIFRGRAFAGCTFESTYDSESVVDFEITNNPESGADFVGPRARAMAAKRPGMFPLW
ncbi:MAG: hypothetical protein ACLFTU_05210, partial [Puniceicoccaceae bacterium]